MNDYEVLYIVSASLSDEERQALVQKFHDFVEKTQGTINSEVEWGLKTLAYPIKKQANGYYYLANLSLKPETVKDLYYFFRVNDGFLRAMIVKKEGKETLPETKVEEVEENV